MSRQQTLNEEQMTRRLLVTSAVALVLTTISSGCGKKSEGPPRASVAGTLTIDGKPIEGVEVHFVNPDHPQHGSFAVTDAEGKFRLVQGAVIGTNTVFFSKLEGDASMLNPDAGMDAGQMEAMAMGSGNNAAAQANIPKQIIPAEYATSESKLTFPVPEGGTTSADFSL